MVNAGSSPSGSILRRASSSWPSTSATAVIGSSRSSKRARSSAGPAWVPSGSHTSTARCTTWESGAGSGIGMLLPGGRPSQPPGQGCPAPPAGMSAEMAEMQQSSALRELAAVPSGGGVISLYLDLDPSRFATEEARSTEVRSLLDEAARQIERLDGWSHDEREALKADLARIRDHFESGEFSAKRAHGLALFASGPAGLFEAVRMQRTVESGVFVDRAPRLGPLVEAAASPGWCVALVNRRTLRAFAGSSARLEEVEALSEHVHGQHDQGGWSQPRYQRSVDKEVAEHLRRSASVLARLHERIPFDHLLVGGPEEIVGDFEEALPHPLRDRLEGRVV